MPQRNTERTPANTADLAMPETEFGSGGTDLARSGGDHAQPVTRPLDPPTQQEDQAEIATPVVAGGTDTAGPRMSAMKVARGTVGRARAARNDVSQGVGKLREISSVMLDEATYDPSLRFVLVAVALFVLFLIILFLSEMAT